MTAKTLTEEQRRLIDRVWELAEEQGLVQPDGKLLAPREWVLEAMNQASDELDNRED